MKRESAEFFLQVSKKHGGWRTSNPWSDMGLSPLFGLNQNVFSRVNVDVAS